MIQQKKALLRYRRLRSYRRMQVRIGKIKHLEGQRQILSIDGGVDRPSTGSIGQQHKGIDRFPAQSRVKRASRDQERISHLLPRQTLLGRSP